VTYITSATAADDETQKLNRILRIQSDNYTSSCTSRRRQIRFYETWRHQLRGISWPETRDRISAYDCVVLLTSGSD